MVLRCAVYLISYQTTSQPRAVVWQLYVVTCAIYYSCQGQAFLLSQVGVTLVCKMRGAQQPLTDMPGELSHNSCFTKSHITAVFAAADHGVCAVAQVMGSNAAQLTAAVSALINALVASKFSQQGALGLMNRLSYARWGLEAYVISETSCLKGERGLGGSVLVLTVFGWHVHV
jgi:hypothetical protein